MSTVQERLFALLPAAYRLRDAAAGEPLRALMAVLERELAAIEADIETTWDNWFVETCEEWLVPYLGEALGVKGLRSVDVTGFSLRGYVANTISRRRRKGTAAATEQLARDVTGYPCRAVELFALTSVTTNVNHVREPGAFPASLGTVDLRDPRPLERLGGAFDPFAHTPDVRPIADGQVRHNLPNLGLFLWRAVSMEVSRSTARPFAGPAGWYRFDPLGRDIPLFNLPRPEEDIAALATPEHVPHPLTRLDLDALAPVGWQAGHAYTAGTLISEGGHTYRVRIGGTSGGSEPAWPVDPAATVADGGVTWEEAGTIHVAQDTDPPIVVRTVAGGSETTLALQAGSLADVNGAVPGHRPVAGTAAVDPELGRLVLNEADVPAGPDAEVLVDYAYGSPGRLGAGPFDRAETWVEQLGAGSAGRQWGVGRGDAAVGDEDVVATLEEAVAAWNAWVGGLAVEERRDAVGLIAITDSRRYAAPASAIQLPDGARLHLVAGSWPARDQDGATVRVTGEVVPNQVRPHVLGDLSVAGSGAGGDAGVGGLLLNGLLVEGAVRVQEGDLESVDVASCTVVGEPAAIIVAAGAAADQRNGRLEIRLRASLVGPVAAGGAITALSARDSLLSSGAWAIDLPGAALDLDGCTVAGGIRGRTLHASDCVLDEGQLPPGEALDIEVRQDGCVRFSYVPVEASSPRRYRCQPDLALEGVTDPRRRARIVARVRPAYDSETLGDPGLYLLATSGPPELRAASSDGSEPGVWHHLLHALRLANLDAALRQYLRFGLEAGPLFDR